MPVSAPRASLRAVRAALPLLVFFGLLAPAWAEPSLDVSVDRTEVVLGDQLSLTVTLLADSRGFGGPQIQEPALDGFAVVGRMSFSSYDSRRRQNEFKLQLQLSPVKPGELVIGPFRYTEAGSTVASEPIKVTVTGGAQGGAGDPNAPAEQAPDQMAFMRWEVEPEGPLWLGQGLRARLCLYVNRQLSVRLEEVSDVNPQGFWTQERGRRERARLVQIGNDVFAREVLWDQHLFPIRVGNLTLPEVSAKMVLSTRGMAVRRAQRLDRKVEALALTVRPLPPQGRPADFAGPAVGEVRLEAQTNRTKVKAEDGFQLTVTTRVDGLIENVPELELPDMPGLKAFPPSATTNTSVRGDQVVGVRRQTWLIRPTQAGRVQVPALSLPYFDPQTGRYTTARTRPVWLTVTGTPLATKDGDPAATAASQASSDGPALRTIRKAPRLEGAAGGAAYTHPLLWAALILPPLALLGLILNDRVQRTRASTAGSRTARKAPKVAKDALAQAGKAGAGQAYTAIAHALEGYFEARFGRPFKGLTHPQLVATLGELGVGADTAQAVVRELENCDFARFAPGAGADDVSEAARRAAALVDRVEQEVA